MLYHSLKNFKKQINNLLFGVFVFYKSFNFANSSSTLIDNFKFFYLGVTSQKKSGRAFATIFILNLTGFEKPVRFKIKDFRNNPSRERVQSTGILNSIEIPSAFSLRKSKLQQQPKHSSNRFRLASE